MEYNPIQTGISQMTWYYCLVGLESPRFDRHFSIYEGKCLLCRKQGTRMLLDLNESRPWFVQANRSIGWTLCRDFRVVLPVNWFQRLWRRIWPTLEASVPWHKTEANMPTSPKQIIPSGGCRSTECMSCFLTNFWFLHKYQSLSDNGKQANQMGHGWPLFLCIHCENA